MKRALFILILAAAVMGGCITDSNDNEGDKPSIVGKWISVTDNAHYAIFRADNTFQAHGWGFGNYTIKGDSLIMVRPNQEKTTFRMTFSLAGNFLSIKDGASQYFDFIRQDEY